MYNNLVSVFCRLPMLNYNWIDPQDVSAECTRRIVAVDGAIKAMCNRLVVADVSNRTSRDLAEQCIKVCYSRTTKLRWLYQISVSFIDVRKGHVTSNSILYSRLFLLCSLYWYWQSKKIFENIFRSLSWFAHAKPGLFSSPAASIASFPSSATTVVWCIATPCIRPCLSSPDSAPRWNLRKKVCRNALSVCRGKYWKTEKWVLSKRYRFI